MSCMIMVFKQMTAYELRISDWSSYVGSSDRCAKLRFCCDQVDDTAGRIASIEGALRPTQYLQPLHVEELLFEEAVLDHPDIVETDRKTSCRERVCQYV